MINLLISVIMSSYNHEEYVSQAIQSVLAQTDVDFEFLIADDGSSDRTATVIASFEDSRIKFFPYSYNRGACAVLNELIERSSGEFIALINSDDYWTEPDKLAYQIGILQSNFAIGACFGRAEFVDYKGVVISRGKYALEDTFIASNCSRGEWLRRFFFKGNCICHPTMLIRKACFEEVGTYDNRLRQLPDFDLWIRLVKKYEIFVSNRVLVNFRVLKGNNASEDSPKNSIRTINEHFLLAEEFFDDVSEEYFMEGFMDADIANNMNSKEHITIHKALLYFGVDGALKKPYELIGLSKLYKLLVDPVYIRIMKDDFSMDELWFQDKMADVESLRTVFLERLSAWFFIIKNFLGK
jgi:glycosyltransferase involved in cell wall biosynthesis